MGAKSNYLRGAIPDRLGLLQGISIAHEVLDMGVGRSRQRDIRPLCISVNIVAHDRESKLLLHQFSEQLKRLEREHGGTVQAIAKAVEAMSQIEQS